MEPDEVPNELVSDAYLDKMERVVLNADSADPPTLPNTPDRRRVHDNFTLAAISEIRSLREWIESVERALADSQAECAALREALTTVLAYNDCPGIEIEPGRLSGCDAARTGATDCPTCSPLSRPPGSREALRAMLMKAVDVAYRQGAKDAADDFPGTVDGEVAAIVARLLPEGGEHE